MNKTATSISSDTGSNRFDKLKIVAGLHKDAELYLRPEARYSIGSSDACDIILLDAGVEEKHLTVTLSQGKIQVESAGAELFLDGKKVSYTSFELSNFQVVGIGDAHIAIGPADESWPDIKPPQSNMVDSEPICTDLVLFDPDRHIPQIFRQPGFFKEAWHAFYSWMSVTDRKIVGGICAFLLALMVFILDACLSVTPQATMVYNPLPVKETAIAANPPQKKGVLLSLLSGLASVQRDTIVGTGLAEPTIPVASAPKKSDTDPIGHIRSVLKKTWGENLTEQRTSDPDGYPSIEFKGYDKQSKQDLVMKLDQNDEGEIYAKGITSTAETKKAIFSQVGDLIRLRVDVSEDIEDVCHRVLKKKGVREPKVKYNIEDNSLTLQGSTKDRKTVSTVCTIVSKAFPRIHIDSKIKTSANAPEEGFNIIGLSTSGEPYAILKDSSKVFKGGRLDNGCTIVGIENDCVTLDCNGSKKKHQL